MNNVYGFIYKAEKNYFLVATLRGNYYVPSERFEIGDIVKLSGRSTKALFSHYENSFDFTSYLHHRFVDYQIKYCTVNSVIQNPWRINAFKQFSLQYLAGDYKTIAAGLIYGDSVSSLSSFSQLQSLSIARLLSVSGFHISFIFHLLNEKYQGRRNAQKLRILELIVSLIFLALTGVKFAFLRLTIDTTLKLILTAKHIYLTRINYQALIAGAILILNPFYLLEFGFIYTFIIVFFLTVLPKFKNIPRFINDGLVLLITFILLMPLNAYFNYEINLFGAIAASLVLPIIMALFILCLPILLIPQYGLFLQYPLKAPVNLLKVISQLKLTFTTGRPDLGLMLVIYIFIFATSYLAYMRMIKLKKIGLIVNCLTLVTLFIPRMNYPDAIHFIDVGQGDSTLIQVENKNYLFDTGGNIYLDLADKSLVPYLKKLKIRRLDSVFITHRDYDHYGALDSLKRQFPITDIYFNDEITEVIFKNFAVLNLNNYRDGSDENHDSAVYYLIYHQQKILLMGDAPASIEKKIMRDNPNLTADIVKLGHHGSSSSSSFDFLASIAPKMAIISCGYNNLYGHPNKSVISTLESLNIVFHRTDLEGTIIYPL